MLSLYVRTANEYLSNYYSSKNNNTTNNTDSGFDLCLPNDIIVPGNSIGFKIPLGIFCESKYDDNSIHGFYLYPRSSTGSKTPLRMSNSLGIIDYDYRGEIIACVDNISEADFYGTKGQRLFQICSYNLSPINIILKNSLSNTSRGENGYGSTGI